MNVVRLTSLKAFKRFLGDCGEYFATRAYHAYGGPGGPSSREYARCSELARRFYSLGCGLSSFFAGHDHLSDGVQH